MEQFYLDEKNAKVLPGIKDVVTVKTEYGKTKHRKLLLLSTINEAHQKFVEEEGNIISLEAFRKLRPKNCVLVGSGGTHSICCCIHCENLALLITTSLLMNLEGFKLLVPNSEKVSPKDIVQLLVCSEDPGESCYMSSCENCKNKAEDLKNELKSVLCNANIESIEYSQWRFQDKSQKMTFSETVDEFCGDFVNSMNEFKIHFFISKKQSSYLYNMKKNLPIGVMMIYQDFAENYSCVTSNEVQTAYFNRKQVSMLTVFVYMSTEDQGIVSQSYVILSDDTRHEKSGSVYASYQKLCNVLDEKFPTRNKTIMVTDGCASQYKNYKMFSNIAHHKEDFGHPLQWVFSATGHGKSVCDGIGMNFSIENLLLKKQDLYCFGWFREDFELGWFGLV